MYSIKIIFISVLSAIIFGILHDLLTAHFCVEYFTMGHPKVIDSNSPILLALTWGVLATWWVGLILGIIIAIAANVGNKNHIEIGVIVKNVIRLLVIMMILAIVMGIIGFLLGKNGTVYLIGQIQYEIPKGKHPFFIADLWAHLTSYAVGFAGGIILAIRIYRMRK